MSASSPPDLKSALDLMARGAREALKLGSLDIAQTLAQEILALDATHADAKVSLGRALFHKKEYARAVQSLSAGLSPNADPDIWIELARAREKIRQWPEAIAAFEIAYKLRPATAVQEAELGHAYGNAREFPGAVAAFARSTALDEKNAEVWNDLGVAQIEVNQLADAQRCFETAISLKPDYLAALGNLSLVLEFASDGLAVVTTAERIAALKPGNPALIQKRGVARLSHGRLVEGWTDYRTRFTNPEHKGWHVGIPKPMWDGTSLKDKGLLVWSDQGLGDQILTASLLPDAIAAAKHVVFSCEPRLATLMQRSFPKLRCVSLFDVPLNRVDVSDTDYQASISELGPVFRPAIQSFPQYSGYLKADPAMVAQLKARYAGLPGQGPIVGLSWRSSNMVAKQHKSVGLDHWRAVLQTPGVRFVSLQYGDATGEVAAAAAQQGVKIYIDPDVDPITDVDLFAAQVAAMDAVVSTSNTTVHMAGALNVPTLCLTPLGEGRPWYWFVGHSVSPWYPSVKHIWQTKRRQWDDVLQKAAKELDEMVARR